MSIVYLLKKWSIITLVSLLIIGLVVPGSSLSRTEARYELRSGDVIFGNDLGNVNSRQTLFHQQTLDNTDVEAVDVDFPLFSISPAGDMVAGPVVADGSSANVIPFGLVDLAMPSISESSYQTYNATDTGFYTASFLGIPPINYGGSPVTSGIDMQISPVKAPSSLIGSSMMFPEMNNIIPGYDRSKASKSSNQSGKSTNVSGSANNTQSGQTPGGGDVHETISGQELTGAESSVPLNYTGQNVTGQNLSYPYFNFKARAAPISNSSLIDRMWRNSHLGTMGRAYEGDTSRPEWILPTEFTKSAIAMANWTKVNKIALNQTVPGTHLMPRFWSLGITSLDNSSKEAGDKSFNNSSKRA